MVTFHTNHGDIVIKTFDDKAPETVKNFLDYCREGFYDNTIYISPDTGCRHHNHRNRMQKWLLSTPIMAIS